MSCQLKFIKRRQGASHGIGKFQGQSNVFFTSTGRRNSSRCTETEKTIAISLSNSSRHHKNGLQMAPRSRKKRSSCFDFAIQILNGEPRRSPYSSSPSPTPYALPLDFQNEEGNDDDNINDELEKENFFRTTLTFHFYLAPHSKACFTRPNTMQVCVSFGIGVCADTWLIYAKG